MRAGLYPWCLSGPRPSLRSGLGQDLPAADCGGLSTQPAAGLAFRTAISQTSGADAAADNSRPRDPHPPKASFFIRRDRFRRLLLSVRRCPESMEACFKALAHRFLLMIKTLSPFPPHSAAPPPQEFLSATLPRGPGAGLDSAVLQIVLPVCFRTQSILFDYPRPAGRIPGLRLCPLMRGGKRP